MTSKSSIIDAKRIKGRADGRNNPEAPESFFHLASLNGGERKGWVRDTLVGGRVYFRKREELNDPHELRPRLCFDGTERDIRMFARKLLVTRAQLSPAKRLQEENRMVHLYRKRPEWVEGMLHEALDRLGIYCVSESCDSELLWAHYADGHRGIAIEYDSNVGLFLAAQRVTYTDQERIINRLVDDGSALFEKSVLIKREAWRYECEWRVVARWQDAIRQERYIRDHRLPPDFEAFMRDQHGPGHYAIPSTAIRSVILGAVINENDEAWIRSIVADMPVPVAIRRAVIERSGGIKIESNTQGQTTV